MTKPFKPSAIPVPELPTQLSSENIELRLLPYWSGVKHFRTTAIAQHMTPQDYYWTIIANKRNPTLVNGKISAFNTRADMYFSRIPAHVKAKLWRNFGAHSLASVNLR